MSEMVDRVARAIEEQMSRSDNFPEDLARAAIEAMREPTQAMIDAVSEDVPTEGMILSVWGAVIDEVLGK